jgi:SAM-dependent methyltransferase
MFLKSFAEIDAAVAIVQKEGIIPHPCVPKNWDLSLVIPRLAGDVIDMGCNGSMVLANCVKRKLAGKKIGIDLIPSQEPPGAVHLVGSLTETELESRSFDCITCLSVIEHGVNVPDFFRESARLLRESGRLFITFDYWDPKIHPTMTILGLPWCIFSKDDVTAMIWVADQYGLKLASPVDWTLGIPVINPSNISPCELSYTFGFIEFRKL